MDLGLSETISEGVKRAFADLPSVLKEVAEPSDTAAAGWSGIFDAITSGAEGAIEKVRELVELLTGKGGLSGTVEVETTNPAPADNPYA